MYDPPAPLPDLEQLSASERFRQALAPENPRLIRSAAGELPAVGLAESAAMLLVIARAEPDNYEVAKLASESPGIELRSITLAAEALAALRPSAPCWPTCVGTPASPRRLRYSPAHSASGRGVRCCRCG